MRELRIIVLVIGFFLCSCANPAPRQRVNYDQTVDFSSLKTWNWADRRPAFSDVLVGEDPIDRFVRKAVTQELDAKGMRLVTADPDFRIDYRTRVREDVETQPGTNSQGYAAWRWVKDLAHGWSREADRTGILELRIFDSSGMKEFWSGEISAPVRDNGEARAKIPEAVKLLLADFPPGR